MIHDFFGKELLIYANFLHNQKLNKTASPRILGGRLNQTDESNTNNIFTQPSTPANPF